MMGQQALVPVVGVVQEVPEMIQIQIILGLMQNRQINAKIRII